MPRIFIELKSNLFNDEVIFMKVDPGVQLRDPLHLNYVELNLSTFSSIKTFMTGKVEGKLLSQLTRIFIHSTN